MGRMLIAALWAMLCRQYDPPVVSASTTWSDVKVHRQMMHAHIPPMVANDDLSISSDDEDGAFDPITAQGGLGGGGGTGPFRSSVFGSGGPLALRKSVYERHGPGSILPMHHSSRAMTVKRADKTVVSPKTPILSDIETPGPSPQVNYRHLFIVHRKLIQRMHNPCIDIPSPFPSASTRTKSLIIPRKLDAIGSMEAGGLAGHSEIVYTLDLVRHRMIIQLRGRTAAEEAVDPYDTILNLSGLSRAMPGSSDGRGDSVEGRDWLVSGSRDKTIRLWALSTSRPRVVRVFHGGHDGSVLSLFIFRPTAAEDEGSESRSLWAASGGSDGKICLWDIEKGPEDRPARWVRAHADSVLCVRGNSDKIVSCSKGTFLHIWSVSSLKSRPNHQGVPRFRLEGDTTHRRGK
jgi:WD40 repeat protein